MKKFFALFAVLTLGLILAGCQGKEYKIALITDVGTINDKSFNQGSWEGVVEYAEENDISHKYYKPNAKSTKDYVDAINLAVKNGAEVVVTPGYLFGEAVYQSSVEHEDVTFILLDGVPTDEDGNVVIKDNVYAIAYAEEQSGFLAGYAAVKEGFTNLGFMGGMAVPAVVRFGYGFIQGAEYAAQEMELADDAISIKYNYLNGFGADPAFQTKAAGWFSSGTEVIFAAAGGAGASVMKAAENDTDKYVIGVDVDQKSESDTVITSAKKELANSVYGALNAYYNDDNSVYKAGEVNLVDVTNDGVGLPEDFSRFDTFDATMYETIYTALENDTDSIRTNIKDDSSELADITADLTKVTVTEVE